jgi:hypothetical protein
VLISVASPLIDTGEYAVPPALPARICPALGAVLGTTDAFVCTSLVTLERVAAAAASAYAVVAILVLLSAALCVVAV